MYAGPPAKKALCAANSSKNPATIVGVAPVRRPSTINCSARRLAGESTAERRPPGASSDPPAAPRDLQEVTGQPLVRPPLVDDPAVGQRRGVDLLPRGRHRGDP